MSDKPSFFAELKRRNVYKVAVAYGIVAWLLIQAASILFPTFEAPAWVMKVFVTAVISGFPVALVLAWAFELTPDGIKRTEEIAPNGSITARAGWKLTGITIVLAVIAASLVVFQFVRPKSAMTIPSSANPEASVAAAQTVSEKSIAVLPFQNLSDDKQNSYFADGVQEEILTTLAKIADLKVISRTSVMHFRDAEKRNLRDIAQQLGVAYVLEGSVQRAENRVRVTAQLIDARTDAHRWAERYDRDLADVFAIQSEIAQKIAEQLQAALSPREKATMQTRPTDNMAAYDFYLRAKEIEADTQSLRDVERQFPLLEEAVARDPAFVPALCMLARKHLNLYWFNADHTEARLELARKALNAAARLRPDDGAVHVARAYLHFHGARDYESALAELELARRTMPNDAEVPRLTGYIERRQGRWEESTQLLKEAIVLDPRNSAISQALAQNYVVLRRYEDAVRVMEGLLTWRPGNFRVLLNRANLDQDLRADLRLKQTLLASEAVKTADAGELAIAQLEVALWQRDYRAAATALAAYPAPDLNVIGGFVLPREWFEGLIALGLGEPEKAHAAFEAARQRVAASLAKNPDDSKALITLAQIDARLGRGDDARREGERAVALLPIARDAIDGPVILTRFANVFAHLGEHSRALDLLEQTTKIPNFDASYGELKLDPTWDPLRNQPRFEKIVASLAPKDSK